MLNEKTIKRNLKKAVSNYEFVSFAYDVDCSETFEKRFGKEEVVKFTNYLMGVLNQKINTAEV